MPDLGVTAEWIRDQIMKITTLCERIVTTQEEQDRRIEKIEEKLDEQRERPGKRWDGLVTALLGAIVAALVAGYMVIPKG